MQDNRRQPGRRAARQTDSHGARLPAAESLYSHSRLTDTPPFANPLTSSVRTNKNTSRQDRRDQSGDGVRTGCLSLGVLDPLPYLLLHAMDQALGLELIDTAHLSPSFSLTIHPGPSTVAKEAGWLTHSAKANSADQTPSHSRGGNFQQVARSDDPTPAVVELR